MISMSHYRPSILFSGWRNWPARREGISSFMGGLFDLMNNTITQKSRAIYMVTDERLATICGVQAKHIAKQWECDVHVFVERRDRSAVITEFHEGERVRYHYEALGGFLPDGLPEDAKWPKIVYLRLFAPRLLSSYARLLYLDADILSLRPAHEVFDLDLPFGLAAVADVATTHRAPHDLKRMNRRDWLDSIGVLSDHYLNSGVLLIDTAIWNKMDIAPMLVAYFKAYPAAARFDQDFLAHVFDGKWTQLSPRMNYQAFALELGLMEALKPVFLHFCRRHKPWHGPGFGTWQAPTDPQLTEIYDELFRAEGVDPEAYRLVKKLSLRRRLSYGLNTRLIAMGRITRRERRMVREWQTDHGRFVSYLEEGLKRGAFADIDHIALPGSNLQPAFDGRNVAFLEPIRIAPYNVAA